MDNNLDDFNNFIYACENILDNAESDVIEWKSTFIKELWEKKSFLANGEMKGADKAWHKDDTYIMETAHKSKSHIEHLMYSHGNSYVILINKKLTKYKERIEGFKIKYDMLNCNVILKNRWFLELYTLFAEYNSWFNDLIAPLDASHNVINTQQRNPINETALINEQIHPSHNPNLWSNKCYILFKYLFDNYYTGTIRQITNIWFFLKEYDPQEYNKLCTKEVYKVFILEHYEINITNFDKAHNKYEDSEYNSMNEHRANFEDSLK